MSTMKEHMRELLNKEWNGKKVWECIRDEELTSAPAFKGKYYDDMPMKIMYVGHAVNGWGELDAAKCTSLDATLETILNQNGPDALDTFVNADGYPYVKSNGNTGVYYHITSKFIRMMKHILELLDQSDSPLNHDTWYHDTKSWNQKFVWSNLYNIAPRDGGNPENKFIKLGMIHYTEVMKAQIEEYKPDVVVFCPLSGYFSPWKKEPSFDDILDGYKECKNEDPVIGKGSLGDTHIIVCKRPDVWGNSYETVENMAKRIYEHIVCVCQAKENLNF